MSGQTQHNTIKVGWGEEQARQQSFIAAQTHSLRHSEREWQYLQSWPSFQGAQLHRWKSFFCGASLNPYCSREEKLCRKRTDESLAQRSKTSATQVNKLVGLRRGM